jgi:hypothetical protein
MKPIFRLNLTLLFGLLAGVVSAQSTLPATGVVRPMQSGDIDYSLCTLPSIPRAASAAVDRCVSRLIKADVQDMPGARVDVNLTTRHDDQTVSPLDAIQFAARPQPRVATSWGVSPTEIDAPGSTAALSIGAKPSPPSSLFGSSPPIITASAEGSPPDAGSAATLNRKLTRLLVRKQEEAKLRQTREAERSLAQECQQLHLSELECKLKLREQKLAMAGSIDSGKPRQQPNH